jgi:hypothetical protein
MEPPKLMTRRPYSRANPEKWIFHMDYYAQIPQSIQFEISAKLERHGIPPERQSELSRDIADVIKLHTEQYERRRERNAQRFKKMKEAAKPPPPPPPPPLSRRDTFAQWVKNESRACRAFT